MAEFTAHYVGQPANTLQVVAPINIGGGTAPTSVVWDTANIDGPYGIGSDQWIMAEGDDGLVYAFSGDGPGWEPPTSPKNSMSTTRFLTGPPVPTAVDLHEWPANPNYKPLGVIAEAPQTIKLFFTGEQDGWVGSYEAHSLDNGATWWVDSSFTNPVFTNQWQGGGGGDGAWVCGIVKIASLYYVFLSDRNEHVYLGRTTDLFNRSAYVFRNSTGWDVWANRQPIHSDVNGIGGDWYHVSCVWNPNINKYLICKGHSTSGLGVYIADEPWGTWTQLYYDSTFLDGFWKFTFQTPQAWMSGMDFWMSYSGYPEHDNIKFIKGTLV